MSRSLFFWISAVLMLLFGGLMFLAPPLAAQAFGVAESPTADLLFHILGAVLLSQAVMNFLVRNHAASQTLAAVLWTNVAAHGLGFIADLWGVGAGGIAFTSVSPGLIVDLFIGVGSLVYVMRMEKRG